MRILLGTGVLTWNKSERVSDRYGTVYLIEDGHTSMTRGPSPSLIDERAAGELRHRLGRLVAKVLVPRQSTHIGDLFRGFFPSVPRPGEEIELGEGSLFTETAYDGGIVVGLRPDDERPDDWLNPKHLYRAHEQLVELYFVEDDGYDH